MSAKEMMDAQEAEANMAHADRLVQETSDAMNECAAHETIYGNPLSVPCALLARGVCIPILMDWLIDTTVTHTHIHMIQARELRLRDARCHRHKV